MREWTDQEVYEQLAALAKRIEGKEALSLADIEAVLFDARFPKHKEAQARKLLKLFTKKPPQ